jgi:hypothetical protein
MSDNLFIDLLPEEERGPGKNINNNMFNDLLPENDKNKIIKNEFKISNEPDKKFLLKDITSNDNIFSDLLPENEYKIIF